MPTLTEQLDSMRNLQENWDGYGAAVPVLEAIELAKEFIAFVEQLRGSDIRAGSVHVTPGRDGGVLFEWDDSFCEHELEIHPDGSLGFLRTDKQTQAIQSTLFRKSRFALPSGLLTKLSEFTAA
ncbi:MAG: hypothetical protein ACRCZF_22915 [Gemmataceae bacterium]